MATKSHRVLIVGAGSIGERHARCFLATGRASVAICEPNDSIRQAVAQRYDLTDSFSNLDEALAQPWDAALIATPAHTHIPIALKLVQHDIALLIEKPLSTSIDGIDQLQKEVDERRLLAAVSYNYRVHPALSDMKKALDENRFGRILQMTCLTGQNFAFYRPAYRSIYFADLTQGGGAIRDAMTHLFNIGEWLAGPIDRLAADAAHQQMEGVAVEDTVHVLARHGNVMASYLLNLYQQPNETSFTLVCERATLRFEVHRSRWRWMDTVDGQWHDEEFPLDEKDTWYILNANAFLDALEGTCAPLCSLEEGVRTLQTIQTTLQAIERNTWLTVSDKEHAE